MAETALPLYVSTACPGCGSEPLTFGMVGVWISPGGARIGYLLCSACSRDAMEGPMARRQVCERVEATIGDRLREISQ